MASFLQILLPSPPRPLETEAEFEGPRYIESGLTLLACSGPFRLAEEFLFTLSVCRLRKQSFRVSFSCLVVMSSLDHQAPPLSFSVVNLPASFKRGPAGNLFDPLVPFPQDQGG